MDVTKRILCLANSRKLNGRCIAGIELEDGCGQHWIRPVSDRPNQEVSEDERMYIDGNDPCVLDLVDTPLLHPAPVLHQQENWLLDPRRTWEKVGRFPWSDLGKLAESESPLWLFAESKFSTY